MNKMERSFKNADGSEETLMMTSDDSLELSLNGSYKLANHAAKKESKLAKKFKGSILGAEIGVKSGGFSSVAILATVIAISALAIMYFMWRF